MCSDGERASLGSSGNGKLRQWLIEQVDTGKYPGLVWENEEKSVFRIPWKHAGKQDYNRDEDAALFKVELKTRGETRTDSASHFRPGGPGDVRCAHVFVLSVGLGALQRQIPGGHRQTGPTHVENASPLRAEQEQRLRGASGPQSARHFGPL